MKDMEKVKGLKIEKSMKVSELVEGMKGMGFGAGRIAEASEIYLEMTKDKSCKVFFGLAGAMVPAGMKHVVLDILDDVDVFVTTGANLTHDLIEALGFNHFKLEKWNDEELREKGLDRMYNVAMPNDAYEKLEDFFEKNWKEFQKCKTIKEFLWKIGEVLSNEKSSRDFVTRQPQLVTSLHHHRANPNVKSLAPTTHPSDKELTEPKFNESILVKCFEKKIPIFCPALADSGIGLMIWGRKMKGSKYEISIDAFEDMKEIIDIAWQSKKNGVIYVGGGVPKNFIQQSLQFSKGADYGIQITTDNAVYGGSSGAPLVEGKSWGKLKNNAKFVDVFCDATIALPLILASVK